MSGTSPRTIAYALLFGGAIALFATGVRQRVVPLDLLALPSQR